MSVFSWATFPAYPTSCPVDSASFVCGKGSPFKSTNQKGTIFGFGRDAGSLTPIEGWGGFCGGTFPKTDADSFFAHTSTHRGLPAGAQERPQLRKRGALHGRGRLKVQGDFWELVPLVWWLTKKPKGTPCHFRGVSKNPGAPELGFWEFMDEPSSAKQTTSTGPARWRCILVPSILVAKLCR